MPRSVIAASEAGAGRQHLRLPDRRLLQEGQALSELKDGAQIAVPNDPTNLGRSLILLEKQGLLKLKGVPVWKRPY